MRDGGGEEGKGRRLPEGGELYSDGLVGICWPVEAFQGHSSLS